MGEIKKIKLNNVDLGDIADYRISLSNPLHNQGLVYNSETSKFENSSIGIPLANILDVKFSQSYDTGGFDDIQLFLEETLALDTYLSITEFLKIKTLSVSVGDYQWSEPTGGIVSTNADVTITFPDGSSVTENVNFFRYAQQSVPVCLSEPMAFVDTGLTFDYSYEFEGKCSLQQGKQGVLIDSYLSNSERTSLRMLSGSQKFQAMWPNNKELTNTGIDFSTPFTFIIKSSSVTIRQGAIDYHQELTGTHAGKLSQNIILLNSAANSYSFSGAIMHYAIIRDSEGNVLRHFIPSYVNNELVIIDIANDNTIYRPSLGVLIDMS